MKQFALMRWHGLSAIGLTCLVTASAAAEPKLIWNAPEAVKDAPARTVSFTRAFTVDQLVREAIVVGTADNRLELTINGKRVVRHGEWNTAFRVDVTPLILKGDNVITARVQNEGGPAMLCLDFRVSLEEGKVLDLSTDKEWMWSEAEQKERRPAVELASPDSPAVAFWHVPSSLAAPKTVPLPAFRDRAAGELSIKPVDRIVLLGDTLIERAQSYGYLETLLTARFPDRSPTFRNLGWSGDNVFGEARAGFGSVEDGYKQLREQIAAVKPTFLIISYGTNESHAGEAGLAAFRAGLNRLLDDLPPETSRIVLLGPVRQQRMPPPFPDPAAANERRALYGKLLEQIAAEHGLRYVAIDSFAPETRPGRFPSWTTNGIHLNDEGYRLLANHLARQLIDASGWSATLDAKSGAVVDKKGLASLDAVASAPANAGTSFTLRPERGPATWPEKDTPWGQLTVRNLPPGNYLLKTADRSTVLAQGDAAAWAKGLPVAVAPAEIERLNTMRERVVAKNRLFFYRWRPQNETYLLGFRKHEQGQNAVEIPKFDPLVEAVENEIASMNNPPAVRLLLQPVTGTAAAR